MSPCRANTCSSCGGIWDVRVRSRGSRACRVFWQVDRHAPSAGNWRPPFDGSRGRRRLSGRSGWELGRTLAGRRRRRRTRQCRRCHQRRAGWRARQRTGPRERTGERTCGRPGERTRLRTRRRTGRLHLDVHLGASRRRGSLVDRGRREDCHKTTPGSIPLVV